MTLRVLVVDDHELWRRELRSQLQSMPGCDVVGEAADGEDAIHKADALRPDLILLDVELPSLNGIAAAARICSRDPSARVLFVSAHRGWDIVAAAMAAGGRGYLLKSDVGCEFATAVRAVAGGERFVSATFTGRRVDPPGDGFRKPRHEVGFYADASRLLDAYGRFLKPALDAGKSVIIATAPSRRDEVWRTLQALAVDVDRVLRERRWIWLDVPDLFASFMVDGSPDGERFWKSTASAIAKAAQAARCEPPGVVACGEGCATLYEAGRTDAVIRLEQLWDEVARTFNVEVFCPYSGAGGHHHDDVTRQKICRQHSAVLSP